MDYELGKLLEAIIARQDIQIKQMQLLTDILTQPEEEQEYERPSEKLNKEESETEEKPTMKTKIK